MRNLFHAVTSGIRITVRPEFAEEHSDASLPRYVFLYHIRIENVGERTAQLLWRHWFIQDSVAGPSEVEGEGVVGEKPVLAPGDVHEYQSFCVLEGTEGSMEGFYQFRYSNGEEFRASIPRFLLRVSPDGEH
jgi:ApaG protein